MHSTTEIKIRGYHVDVFGHVNHARYVELLEEARWGFFDHHQPVVERLHARGIIHAVVRLEIDYRRGARVGDLMRIETSIKEVGHSSVVVQQNIFQSDSNELILEAQIVSAFLQMENGKPISIRDEMLPLSENGANIPTSVPDLVIA